jgi:hypothetical protein
MASKNTQAIRVHDLFRDDVYDIKGELEKKFKREVSSSEITEAIRKRPLWKNLKEEIIKFSTDENASGWDYIILSIFAFMMVIIFIFWSFGFHLATQQLVNLPSLSLNNQTINVSNAFAQTFGKVDSAYLNLRWLGVLMIFVSFIGIFISNAFVRDVPIAFLIYVCYIVINVFLGVQISNAYQMAVNDPNISAYASQWIGYNWVMFNLPIILTVVGFFGSTVIFINLITPGRPSYA